MLHESYVMMAIVVLPISSPLFLMLKVEWELDSETIEVKCRCIMPVHNLLKGLFFGNSLHFLEILANGLQLLHWVAIVFDKVKNTSTAPLFAIFKECLLTKIFLSFCKFWFFLQIRTPFILRLLNLLCVFANFDFFAVSLSSLDCCFWWKIVLPLELDVHLVWFTFSKKFPLKYFQLASAVSKLGHFAAISGEICNFYREIEK